MGASCNLIQPECRASEESLADEEEACVKRYTEAELIDFENYFRDRRVAELTNYIRRVVGTVEIPQFPALPNAIERSILRHRRKLAREAADRALLRHLRRVARGQSRRVYVGRVMAATDAG